MRVDIDGVGVKDRREIKFGKDGRGKVIGEEGIFLRACIPLEIIQRRGGFRANESSRVNITSKGSIFLY